MKFLKIALAAVIALSAMGASAQTSPSKMSGEIGYSALQLNSGGYSSNPGMVRGLLDYAVNDNLAIEGMVGFSAAASDLNVGAVTISTKVDNAYGIYLKPKFKASKDLELFARIGYSTATLTAAANGLSISDTQSSAAYGVGVSYSLTPSTFLSLDYMSLYDKDGSTIKGTTLGIGYRF